VMTRLHIQVNQTIQFYRGQQGGQAPVRLFLSGGASTMPYTAQFFAEKLNMPVDYFNPLRNVQIDPGVNIEELAKIGHQMGELVGLGLRNLAHCPIELNLMPKSALQGQEFGAKKPYLIATMACLVAILFAFGYFNDRIANIKRGSLEKLQPELSRLQSLDTQIEAEERKLRVARIEAEQLAGWLEDRPYWGNLLMELRQVMLKTEREGKAKFNTDTGIWIERMVVECPPPGAAGAGGLGETNLAPRPRGRGRGGPAVADARGDCNTISILCRAADLSHIAPDANDKFAYALNDQLKASALLSTNSGVVGSISPPERDTVTVPVVLFPKRPIKH
jgi:hypothetical protein